MWSRDKQVRVVRQAIGLHESQEFASYERRFRRAGLPLFIEDYSATRDVFTLASPLLGAVFVGEMLLALHEGWSWWQNTLAVLGGFLILAVANGILNRRRGERFWSLPDRIGTPELAAFVLVPPLIPLVFIEGVDNIFDRLPNVAIAMAANLLFVGVVYLIVGYGLIAIVVWAFRRMAGQLATSLILLTKAVPLLLIFALVLFINTEMWQVFSRMPGRFLTVVGFGFGVLGILFIAVRVPREVRRMEHEVGAGAPDLTRRQRINVGLVMVVSQTVQVLVVAFGVGLFFVGFGLLAIDDEIREAWAVFEDRVVLWDGELLGLDVWLDTALLKVSGGIAAFAGLYYAIAVLTDGTYREEFRDELTGAMRETFRLRAEYIIRYHRADSVEP